MILVDHEIKALLDQGVVEYADPRNIGSASLDLTITVPFKIPEYSYPTLLEMDKEDPRPFKSYMKDVILPSGGFVLCATKEKFNLPDDISVQIFLRSSSARLGLNHMLAGWVDAGFRGVITLEFTNVNPYHGIKLRDGQSLVQAVFYKHEKSAGYSGRYQNSLSVLPSLGAK